VERRFRYILVDEYQDTNHAQYVLISLLAAKHRNLCVVATTTRAFINFRGATIENILSFESQYKNAAVIRLEENYRSTQNILSAATRSSKKTSCAKGKSSGQKTAAAEKSKCASLARIGRKRFIADTILDKVVRRGYSYKDFAVYTRVNAQVRQHRAPLLRIAPSRTALIGGLRFYDRKEIKDMIAYLSVLENPGDDCD
jgi:DNA helicase-2/ATP-dependent DNA helicase PcrA